MVTKEQLKEWIYHHKFAERTLCNALLWQAARHETAGNYLNAIKKLSIAHQRVRNEDLAQAVTARLHAVLRVVCSCDGRWKPIADNCLLQEYRASDGCTANAHRVRSNPREDAIRLRVHRADTDNRRQGNMIILKRPVAGSSEKGVLFLKYNESFSDFAATFNLAEVAKHYRVVLEPSNAGAHEEFFYFVGSDLGVVMQCPDKRDYDFIKDLGSNIVPVAFGAGDWVDEEFFCPTSREKEFDVAMVARWGPLKRHHVLFSALAALRPKRFKTVLIGYPLEWTTSKIQRMLARRGLQKQCTIMENLPPEKVATVLSRSRVSVSVSLHEGAIRALSESLFCDTPILVNERNVGVNRDLMVAETGRFAKDENLAEVLEWMVEHSETFSPRKWALRNTGAKITTERLNIVLKRMATDNGEPWTVDIVQKVNRPNLSYRSTQDQKDLDVAYDELARLAGEF